MMLRIGILFSVVAAAASQAVQQGPSQRLTSFLLSRHNRAAPPDGRISMDFELELVNILNLDEVGQTITVLVYVEEKWTDASLSWNPEDFGNVTVTWLPQDAIWLPDIIIFNMLKHEHLLHSVRAPVLIRNSGQVIYTYPSIYTVMCSIDVSMFPLDEQHCALEISSWEYEEYKLQLNPRTSHALDHFQPNEEWKLVHIDVNLTHFSHEDITVAEIYFLIHIRRRPFFYMISLVVPSFIITVLSITGLFAPFSSTGERQEKFTLGVTAILTMAVLSLMVSEKVPHTSKNVPLLVGYFMTLMVLIAVASVLTSFIMRVHRKGVRGDQEAPAWLLHLLAINPNSLPHGKRKKPSGIGNGEVKTGGAEAETAGLLSDIHDNIAEISDTLSTIAASRAAFQEGGWREERGMVSGHLIGASPTWIQVAARLDLIGLSLFLAIVVSLTARIAIMGWSWVF